MTPAEIGERLVRIETRLDALCKQLMDNGQPGQCTRHGQRLGALEDWRSSVSGGLRVAIWAGGILTSSAGAVLLAKAITR